MTLTKKSACNGNMKERAARKVVRAAAILMAALIMTMLSVSLAFAADFRVESVYPEDGAKNTTKDNMCVKVTFSNEVGNQASRKANQNAVKITDPDGKVIPTVIYYNKKDPKYALIHIDTTKVTISGKDADIKDDTEYTCTISGNFTDNDGNTLGTDQKVSFTTQNQGRGMMVYMIIMVVFMVGMIGFTVFQTRKDLMAEAGGDSEEGPFNPYKEAKKTGKSVEEVILEHQKKMKGKNNKKDKVEEDPKRDGDYYRVKRPHPISEAGSTYKTGRKAKAEAEAKKRAEEKARRKKEGYSKKKRGKKK